MQVSKLFAKHVAGTTLALALVAGQQAFAAAPDYSAVTSGVDWGTAITGILALAGLVAGVLAVVKGVKFMFRLLA